MLPCSNPWESLSDDAQLTEEEIEMLRQPSHGTRTTVLGQPSMADLQRDIQLLQQSVAALGTLLHSAFANTENDCDCESCGGKTFDATGWGD